MLKVTALVEISAPAILSELNFQFDHCEGQANLITVVSKLQMNDCSFETEKDKGQVLLFCGSGSTVSINSCIVNGFKQHISGFEAYISINTSVFEKAQSSSITLNSPCYFQFSNSQILNARMCGVLVTYQASDNTKTRILNFSDS